MQLQMNAFQFFIIAQLRIAVPMIIHSLILIWPTPAAQKNKQLVILNEQHYFFSFHSVGFEVNNSLGLCSVQLANELLVILQKNLF